MQLNGSGISEPAGPWCISACIWKVIHTVTTCFTLSRCIHVSIHTDVCSHTFFILYVSASPIHSDNTCMYPIMHNVCIWSKMHTYSACLSCLCLFVCRQNHWKKLHLIHCRFRRRGAATRRHRGWGKEGSDWTTLDGPGWSAMGCMGLGMAGWGGVKGESEGEQVGRLRHFRS
jgi:hypothetical protein